MSEKDRLNYIAKTCEHCGTLLSSPTNGVLDVNNHTPLDCISVLKNRLLRADKDIRLLEASNDAKLEMCRMLTDAQTERQKSAATLAKYEAAKVMRLSKTLDTTRQVLQELYDYMPSEIPYPELVDRIHRALEPDEDSNVKAQVRIGPPIQFHAGSGDFVLEHDEEYVRSVEADRDQCRSALDARFTMLYRVMAERDEARAKLEEAEKDVKCLRETIKKENAFLRDLEERDEEENDDLPDEPDELFTHDDLLEMRAQNEQFRHALRVPKRQFSINDRLVFTALDLSAKLKVAEAALKQQEKTLPICDKCNDSHEMFLGERKVMCTFCPSPCRECGRGGPFCTTTPCACTCHANSYQYLKYHKSSDITRK